MGEIMTNNFKKLFGFFSVGFGVYSTTTADAASHEGGNAGNATKGCDPIQVVIHASYGGGTDTTANIIQLELEEI